MVDRTGSICMAGNGAAVALSDIPTLPMEAFREVCVSVLESGGRLSAFTVLGSKSPGDRGREMLALLADDTGSYLGLLRTPVPDSGTYRALSADVPQAQGFERELAEDFGLVPEEHPWLKPLRRHAELERLGAGARAGVGAGAGAGTGAAYHFLAVEGATVHEVAVGPVHAGIIEPGHFRFQCHGETVLHLEIQLGYQHRGAEALLLESKPVRRLAIAESVAGDSVIGHSLAYCAALEGLCGAEAPLAAQAIRGIALELERCANHVGDLGALCGDAGYLPGAAWFGQHRGDFLNMLLEITGNRFGRSLVIPGGVRFGIDPVRQVGLIAQLDRLERDLSKVSEIVFECPSVVSRMEQSGILEKEDAEELGIVGPAARASGCDRDVRRDHPSGIYRFAHIPVALQETGDVMARAVLRWTETQRSMQFIREHLEELKEGPLATTLGPPRPHACVASMVEGWRGEIVHLAVTDEAGDLASYKMVDPSFHNWLGLAMVMRGRQISDFPLCNKSFNLSYAGHDL